MHHRLDERHGARLVLFEKLIVGPSRILHVLHGLLDAGPAVRGLPLVQEPERGAAHESVGLDRGAPLEGERQLLGAGVAYGDVARLGIPGEREIDGGMLARLDAVALESAAQNAQAGLRQHHHDRRSLFAVGGAAEGLRLVGDRFDLGEPLVRVIELINIH